MNNARLIGGILLILGTSIGAGMLALPIAVAAEGFVTASFLLIVSWCCMTIGAFCVLEAVLWLPPHSNLISMARVTLGRGGQWATWITYLFLLYALLCAYIAGTSDIVYGMLNIVHFGIPQWMDTVLVVGVFGFIVYRGIYSVDILNRGLMSGKIIIFLFVVFALLPHLDFSKLYYGRHTLFISTITVMITSFGFAIIVPSLRSYFHDDVKKLRLAILIGSLIPLIFYLTWIAVVHAIIPLEGLNGLLHMLVSGHSTSDLTQALNSRIGGHLLPLLIRTFTSICAITSFLGVALCLFDFLADGLHLGKKRRDGWILCALTFIPPLIIVLFAPGIFISALSYAGIFCIILLMLLPALMVWSGRYLRHIATGYQLIGGRGLLFIEILVAIILILWSLSRYL